ncbi:TRAM domain-containing protein [Patescibacteria group bacterium]|nr:TRAM domain-containing protein [Patescibacteria group bacterium]
MRKQNSKKLKIMTNVTIEKIGYGGVGIAKHADGRKIIVTGGVLPGMTADILVTKQKKDFTEGKLYHVHSYDKSFTLDPSAVKCPHYVFHSED